MVRTVQKKNTQLAKTIGLTIAKYRQQRELTQEQVAEKLSIGLEAVSRLERGIVMPTVERLVELAEIFGCEALDLLTESSHRLEDQTAQMNQLLKNVSDGDRLFIVKMVEEWVKHLQEDKEYLLKK